MSNSEQTASHAKTAKGRQALIVDDDPIVRSLLQHQLGMLGIHDCDMAGDGREAMELIKTRQGYLVIFCDLKMPGMDGIEFLRHVAKWIPEVHLVLVSSVDVKVLRAAASFARAHQLRLLGTLNKPVRLETLKAILQRLDRQERTLERPPSVRVGQSDLETALAEGQIRAYFQPQVDVASGKLLSAEALVRWEHPQGVLQPGQFLCLAEDTGNIGALTDRVMVQSLEAIAAWRRQGLSLNVSVNLTMDVLSELDFPDRLSTLCGEHGVESRHILLEITESGAMRDPAVTMDVVTRLRMRGFELAIDDFGTGFSSLRQLREIPFSELKIDQSFVSIAHLDEEARQIVESNIGLARNLKMRSVAEGVETREDWVLLRALGCDVLQGYFVNKAIPAQDFLTWAQEEYAGLLSSGELPPG